MKKSDTFGSLKSVNCGRFFIGSTGVLFSWFLKKRNWTRRVNTTPKMKEHRMAVTSILSVNVYLT